jgi:hypothetical protein
MGAAGFELVRTEEHWLVHQVTQGIKPLPVENASENFQEEETDNTIFAPA